MKIYTGTGDKGETFLFRGGKVSKSSERIEAYGTVDELNSVVAVAIQEVKSEKIKSVLKQIQNELFILGADLATPHESDASNGIERIAKKHIDDKECLIDEISETLPELKNFILPGGTKGSAYLQLARTVCRRAERRVVVLQKISDLGEFVLIYLNRLSDLFFVLARFENHANNIPETIWESPS